MSYRQSLEAAGARIIAFEHFGDWQGSWVALVEYQGETGWVHGWFGSCTECDAFQSEFGFDDDFKSEYERERLASFGRTYLEGLMPIDNLLRHYLADSEWDTEAADVVFWIRETAQTYGVAA
jgi:hypothetical protein